MKKLHEIRDIFKCTACGHTGLERIQIREIIIPIWRIRLDGKDWEGKDEDECEYMNGKTVYQCSECCEPVDLDEFLKSIRERLDGQSTGVQK